MTVVILITDEIVTAWFARAAAIDIALLAVSNLVIAGWQLAIICTVIVTVLVLVVTGLAILRIDNPVATPPGAAWLFCAISRTDRTGELAVVALFGFGVVIVTLFRSIDPSIAAKLGCSCLFGAVSGTNGAVELSIIAFFCDGVVVITGLSILPVDYAIAA